MSHIPKGVERVLYTVILQFIWKNLERCISHLVKGSFAAPRQKSQVDRLGRLLNSGFWQLLFPLPFPWYFAAANDNKRQMEAAGKRSPLCYSLQGASWLGILRP